MSYRSTSPVVLQHPCEGHGPGGGEPKAAVYLGKDIFISLDAFESSLSLLSIPEELEAKEALLSAIVSAIAFVHKDGVLMVVNGQVYLYFKSFNRWVPSAGVTSPMSKLSNTLCCYTGADPQFKELSSTLFAYDTRCPVSDSHIFLSQDGGYKFTSIETSTREQGVLLRGYNFISFAVTGLLINRGGEDGAGKAAGAYFRYNGTENSHVSNHSSATFHLLPKGPAKLWSIQNLALRGFFILWTTDTLLISANNGLTMEEVSVMPLETFQSTTFPGSGFLHVTASSSQIAVVTQDKHLFYGSISRVTSMVHIAKDESIDLKNTGMLFEERGWLTLLNSVISNFTQLYDLNKCKLNLQLAVWRSQQSCTVEILMGDFQNKIYYIDMHESLTLKAIFVHKPGKRSTPLVTVSNTHVLAFSAYVIKVGFTYDGNTEYLLRTVLEQQYFPDFADTGFCDGVQDRGMSAVTVDIPDNPISCIDAAPLTALVAVSCPATKHIRIVKNVTACDRGLIQEAELRNNFSYTISHNIYDSHLLARKDIQQDDLQIKYNFTNLGCPLLVYYKNSWVPIFELWENNTFQEHVPAEFVPFEINGMRNYDYHLTVHDAICISQPQIWTSLLEELESPDPNTAWTRRNYMSCKDRNGPKLKWPSVKYQVLDGNKNKIIFPPRNGLYIFKAIVVDTFYSYCDLSVTFSVYVHGAFPRNYLHFWASLTVFLIFTFDFYKILLFHLSL
ncbi:cation channel sperm-associated auxiliary subunit delta [Gymnogyps californianus]|uniref:cation channel sperm-associated auxiliary subunit delta n=1 Tax=Gymnogyps californianus TaxID=33616 RepID=UPI0021C70A3C|nr:cation channel sperm-associated auxiliary subunit delta [Gymnogyps californianus]